MNSDLVFYSGLLREIKDRIRQAQVKATVSANAEMIRVYWDIGRMIHQRQQMEGWGAESSLSWPGIFVMNFPR